MLCPIRALRKRDRFDVPEPQAARYFCSREMRVGITHPDYAWWAQLSETTTQRIMRIRAQPGIHDVSIAAVVRRRFHEDAVSTEILVVLGREHREARRRKQR